MPERALTVGLGTLYRARELILLVTGGAKAHALRAMLEEPVSRGLPGFAAARPPAADGDLRPRGGEPARRSGRMDERPLLVVLGHREPGVSPEHRISPESRARLRTALRLARATPVRAVVLTGYTSGGGLSEAEQMKGAWDESEAPALLEVAGRNTAENASRSLPILLAAARPPGHRRLVGLALRVPWFFAPYRRYGIEVCFRASFSRHGWAPLLARELKEARRAREERRAAMAGVHAPPWDAVA